MSFSDERFSYGPFVPHWIPKQYIQNYFASHQIDRFLVLNTTVEDISQLSHRQGWNLALRRHDPIRGVDIWWQEQFDAVILANGHYSVPFVGAIREEAFIMLIRLLVDTLRQRPRRFHG